MKITGKCSHFGGPEDTGVSPSEGLAFIFDVSDAPQLFLPEQPLGTTGLARRLDPATPYVACRWDYDAPHTSKEELLKHTALVYAPATGRMFQAYPADWGPSEATGRTADISPGLMQALGITTDDVVEVTYPYPVEPAMAVRRIAMSSGHSTKCQGAIGPEPWGLNEVDEAQRVVDRVAHILNSVGVTTLVFKDTVSTSQGENLERIIDWHNGQVRDLDVSVHLNASEVTAGERGVEVLWYSQEELARVISAGIAQAAHLPDRGPKYRDDLTFLRSTDEKAVLIEVVFVDAEGDVTKYETFFDDICLSIAASLSGIKIDPRPPEPERPVDERPIVAVAIECPDGVELIISVNGVGVLLGDDA